MARAASPNPEAVFSAELRTVLEGARDIARQGQAKATNPDHLACALLAPRENPQGKVETSLAADLLTHLDFDVAALYRTLLTGVVGTGKPASRARPVYSSQATLVIAQAGSLALADSAEAEVTSAHLLLALVESAEGGDIGTCVLVERLSEADVTLTELRAKWSQMRRARAAGGVLAVPPLEHGAAPGAGFTVDLTAAARAGKLDPIIGRDAEIERVIRILSRRTKNNPVLLGPAGVGKTAVAEGLAQRIVSGDVPERLLSKRILTFSPAAVVAGTKYRGDFEARIIPFLKSASEDPDVILFIDEVHTIVGAGSGDGGETNDLATIMKPMLARGELPCIGATTLDDYRKYIEGDAALERRFAPVDVREPSQSETLAILAGIVGRYAAFHKVIYPEAVLEACVSLAGRHLPERRFPDKAIDVMDEAGTKASLDKRTEVAIEDTLAAVAGMASTTVEALAADPVAGSLAARLAPHVIGQDSAVTTLATIVESRRLGLTERKAPLASFILVGPTGSGKSTLAEALAAAEFNDTLLTINLANYTDKTSLTQLTGAPPSYIGFDEPARLVEPLRRRGSQVVLLQHVDVAAKEVRDLLAGVLRTGSLADTHDRKASFRDAVLIFTVTEQAGAGAMGFRAAGAASAAAESESRMRTLLGPDLLDLIDAVITFTPLEEESLEAIASAQLAEIQESLARRHHIDLAMSPAVRKAIVARVGKGQGARPIRRAVERMVEHPVAAAFAKPSRRAGRYVLDMGVDGAVVRAAGPKEVTA